MATKAEKKAAAAAAKAAKAAASVEKGTAKYNSAGKKRKTADLKGTEKGALIRIIRGAISITNREKGSKEEAKKLAGRMNSTLKPGGKIDMIDTGSEIYSGLKAAAKNALPELQSNTYGSGVKALITYIEDNMAGTGGGGGRKGFNPSAYLDIEL